MALALTRVINYSPRVTPQCGASLTEDSFIFIVEATGWLMAGETDRQNVDRSQTRDEQRDRQMNTLGGCFTDAQTDGEVKL
jgi:hypothetical protein